MRRAEPRAAWAALAAGAGGVLLLGPTSWTNILAAAGCLAVLGFGLWRAGWIGSRYRIAGLRWQDDGRWLLVDSRETAVAAELSPGTRLASGLLWLQWRTVPGRQRSMLLRPGDLPAGQLRALAVRLRIEALERVSPESRPR
ncbi:MAG TPA: hypothetical protein VH814_19855 [Steroidobacteraceae bacterium]|jgi:hypothetical protein